MKLHSLPGRHDREAMDIVHRVRAALDGDVEDTVTAQTIRELNNTLTLNQELFLTVWGFLNSEERRAWKLYCKG